MLFVRNPLSGLLLDAQDLAQQFVEGIITCGIGIFAYFTLTDRPETARWLTAEEKALTLARIKSEAPVRFLPSA